MVEQGKLQVGQAQIGRNQFHPFALNEGIGKAHIAIDYIGHGLHVLVGSQIKRKAALRVEVYEEHFFAKCGHSTPQIDGGGGFAGASFLVYYGDDGWVH